MSEVFVLLDIENGDPNRCLDTEKGTPLPEAEALELVLTGKAMLSRHQDEPPFGFLKFTSSYLKEEEFGPDCLSPGVLERI